MYTLRFEDEDAGFPSESWRLEEPQQVSRSLRDAEFSRRLQTEEAKASSLDQGSRLALSNGPN